MMQTATAAKNTQKAWIHGYSGRMGTLLSQQIKNTPGWQLAGQSAQQFGDLPDEMAHKMANSDTLSAAFKKVQPDIIFDFSSPKGTEMLLKALTRYCNTKDTATCPHVLIATTGLDEHIYRLCHELTSNKQCKILIAPNTSLGIKMLAQLSSQLAKILTQFDIEIIEAHHREKIDSPSGTALFLAENLAKTSQKEIHTGLYSGKRPSNCIGVHALRGGRIFGEHEICFLGEHEEIRISHRALSRELFAQGAIKLGEWLINQEEIKLYELSDVCLPTT